MKVLECWNPERNFEKCDVVLCFSIRKNIAREPEAIANNTDFRTANPSMIWSRMLSARSSFTMMNS